MSDGAAFEAAYDTERLRKPTAKVPLGLRAGIPWAAYALLLAAVSLHLYRTPEYSMDSIQYMGNALLTGNQNISQIHTKVYAEVNQRIPEPARSQLKGNDPRAPADQNRSRELRSRDAGVFAQYLPFFAIRPLYNLTLRYVSRTSLGLVRASVFISTAAYFLSGILLLLWMQKYCNVELAAVLAFLTMLAPPLMAMARENTSDALATFVAFVSLYVIFETPMLAAGLVLLLASIYFRTDFVALAGPVILVSWLGRKIKLWHGAILSAVALASALAINHYAGDYGFGMLYYRNFVGTPAYPGEMTIRLSVRDYIVDFRSGITGFASGFFFPYFLAGVVTFLSSKRLRPVMAVTTAYCALHFIALPNWHERWFGIFYLSIGLGTAALVGVKTVKTVRKIAESLPQAA